MGNSNSDYDQEATEAGDDMISLDGVTKIIHMEDESGEMTVAVPEAMAEDGDFMGMLNGFCKQLVKEDCITFLMKIVNNFLSSGGRVLGGRSNLAPPKSNAINPLVWVGLGVLGLMAVVALVLGAYLLLAKGNSNNKHLNDKQSVRNSGKSGKSRKSIGIIGSKATKASGDLSHKSTKSKKSHKSIKK